MIKEVKKNIYNFSSKENSELIKSKIKKEIKSSVKKDRIIKKEDAELIRAFIDKIKSDLYGNN